MPKTRHEYFCKSFDTYISNLKINEIEYNLNYVLINATDNKTKRVHLYTLEVLGTREDLNTNNENVITLLPTTNDFIDNMNNYFEPYILYRHSRIKMSYIKINTARSNDFISVINFEIHYFRDHLPFPKQLPLLEILIEDIDNLRAELFDQGKQLRRMRRKYNTEKEKLQRVQHNIQKKMEKIYTEKSKLDDCPVCMEPIQKNNLYVPICFHYICVDCSKRCEKCPLCREGYVSLVQ